MSNIKQIELPDGTIYDIIDATAIHPSDVDSSLDDTSTNPIQNASVATAVSGLGGLISTLNGDISTLNTTMGKTIQVFSLSGISDTTAIGDNGCSWTIDGTTFSELLSFVSSSIEKKAIYLSGTVTAASTGAINLLGFYAKSGAQNPMSSYHLFTGTVGTHFDTIVSNSFWGNGYKTGTFIFAFPTTSSTTNTVYLYFFNSGRSTTEISNLVNSNTKQYRYLATAVQTAADSTLVSPKQIIIDTGIVFSGMAMVSPSPTITIEGYLPSSKTTIDIDLSFQASYMMSLSFNNIKVVNRSTANISQLCLFSTVSGTSTKVSIGIVTTDLLSQACFYVKARNLRDNMSPLTPIFSYDGWGFRFATLTNSDRIPSTVTNCELTKAIVTSGVAGFKNSSTTINLQYLRADSRLTYYGTVPANTTDTDNVFDVFLDSVSSIVAWSNIAKAPIMPIHFINGNDRIIVYAQIISSGGNDPTAQLVFQYATINEAYVSSPTLAMLAGADIEFSFYVNN